MPDLPIVIPDTVVAPKDYTLSGTQELQLKTVRALIDGSAAASAFLPTLQLLDPNGHVMWEGATSSTVAAGGSADVSWFPGLAATAAASTGTGPVLAYGTNVTLQTVTAGTSAFSSFATAVHTSDSSKLSWSTSTVANDTLTLHGSGFAMLTASCTWTAGTKIDYRILSSGGETLPHDGFDSMSGYDATFGIQKSTLMDVALLDTTSPTIQCLVNMTNSDGADSGPTLAGLVCLFYPGLT